MTDDIRALVPEDAGPWAHDLEDMIRRIPEGFGRHLAVPRGWFPIIVRAHERIKALLPEYELLGVRQKYGGLRFYYEASGLTEELMDQIDAIVEEAERAAIRTCEVCGEPGCPRVSHPRSPWVKTLCTRCAGDEWTTDERWARVLQG